jgi:hypothetical protein
MLLHARHPALSRRTLLLGAAATALGAPLAARSQPAVCTPRDLAQRYRTRVEGGIELPRGDAMIYASLAEMELAHQPATTAGPQYLLVVDSCPFVQAAFLFWRLLPGRYEIVGVAPASTGDPERAGCVATPCGVFTQAGRGAGGALASRIYDFGVQRTRRPGADGFAPLHLQAHAARGRGRALLGTPQSDGRVLLPPSLVAFLDEYGVLDAGRAGARTPAGEQLPFAGRSMVVLDSEQEERPAWAAG